MRILSILAIVFVVIFTQGCGSEQKEDKVKILSPKSGDIYSIDETIPLEFIGPDDQPYYISVYLVPIGNTPVAIYNTRYSEEIGGYYLFGTRFRYPKNVYDMWTLFPKWVPTGEYIVRVTFGVGKTEKEEILNYIYSSDSGAFTITPPV